MRTSSSWRRDAITALRASSWARSSPRAFAAYLFAEQPFIGDSAVASSVALWRTHKKFFASKNFYRGVHLVGVNAHGPGLIHPRT